MRHKRLLSALLAAVLAMSMLAIVPGAALARGNSISVAPTSTTAGSTVQLSANLDESSYHIEIAGIEVTFKASKDGITEDVATGTKLGTYTVTISGPNAKVIAAIFSVDGAIEKLTWDELKEEANGTKYGYIASSIKDTTIDENAFYICTSLMDIDIPDTVTSIDGTAFTGCISLVSVKLPDELTSIGYGAFGNCPLLSSITFQGTVEDGNNITKGSDWDYESTINQVVCSDGTVALHGPIEGDI